MSFSLDDESFQLVLADFVSLVLPKPFNMCGGQQLEDNRWTFRVWLSVDNYLIGRDIKIERLVLAQEVGFVQTSLKQAAGVIKIDIGHCPAQHSTSKL